jgi:hypothetical protein
MGEIEISLTLFGIHDDRVVVKKLPILIRSKYFAC